MPNLAPIVADPVAELIIGGQVAAAGSNSTPCGNVFYYRLSLQVVAPTKVALNAIFQSTVIAPMLLAMNSRYTPNNVVIRYLNDASDGPTSFAAAGAGAIITDSEPSSDSVVVRLRSAFRGKTMRGFKHFGASSEIDTTGDVLTGAGLIRWQAVRDACGAQLTDALGNKWNPFVRSRQGEQVKINPTTVRGVDITSVVLNLVVSTMRKRKAASVV